MHVRSTSSHPSSRTILSSLVPPLFTLSPRPFALPTSLCFSLRPTSHPHSSISFVSTFHLFVPFSPLSIYVTFRIIAFFVERVWLNSVEIIHLPNCHSSTWIVDASPRKPSPPATPALSPLSSSTPIPIRDNDEFRLSFCNRASRVKSISLIRAGENRIATL